MKLSRQSVSLGIAASVAVHAVIVAAGLGYIGADFSNASVEAVPISVVTSDDIEARPNSFLRPEEPSQPELPQPLNDSAAASPAPLPPDISLRYQVDLGLKPIAIAPAAKPQIRGTSDFDSPAIKKAGVDASAIAAFRANLKMCAALPSTIHPGDKIVIMLRAAFRPDGRLDGVPILIEASASAKGPLLMQTAIAALQSCQPHTTLPPDKFAEWRVLDLRFTPQDFGGS